MSFQEASGIITQTGTDTDLSGLNGVTGVVVVDNGSHKTYHIDGKQLKITGTLTLDPQVECLLFERYPLYISGTLNFGVTSVIGGATRYSRAIGLISHDINYARFLVQSGGTLNWNGGAMKLTGGCDFMSGSNVSITNGIIIATNSISQRLRMNSANCSVDGLSIDGNLRFDVFKTFVKFDRYNPSFNATGIIQKVGSLDGGTDDPLVLTDFDAQGIESPNGDFLGSSYRATKIEFVNMGFTGDFNITHDANGGTSAVSTLYKDIKLKIVDTDISNIEGAKYWTTDKNNGSRFSGTAVWRGSQNANETFSSDRVYTGSTDSSGEATERLLTRACYGGLSTGGVYNGSTTIDYRGETTDNTDVFTFKVASYAHTLNNVSPSCLGIGVLEQQVVLFSDVFLTEPNKILVDEYTEIDAPQKFYDKAKAFLVDNFAGETQTIVTRDGNTIDAGSYDVTIDPNASAVFDLLPAQNTNDFPRIRVSSISPKVISYGEFEMYASHVIELNGTSYPQYTTAELNLNLERFFLYTELDPNDSTKVRWYLMKNTSMYTNIAESESSATLPIHPYDNIAWKDDQSNDWYNGLYPLDVTQMQSSIAIKASTFLGNITTTGTVSLNDVNYTGTITDSSGVRSFGSFEVKNLLSGSRVQVYNVTKNAEIYNDIVNDTALTRGFSTDEMVDGDSIRVRVAYQDGSTAREPQEFSVTCRTPFWDVTANQENATQYNAYQVDGSGISEFTLDLANGKIEVDISDSDNSTNIQRVGAWYYSQLMTSDGIASLFGAINWIADNQISIDQSKVNLQLDNKKSEPLVLTGGRLYRLDETTIIAPTSNSIQIDYSPIYITNAPLIEDINKNTKLIPALL
jgi:hypothetical protein